MSFNPYMVNGVKRTKIERLELVIGYGDRSAMWDWCEQNGWRCQTCYPPAMKNSKTVAADLTKLRVILERELE